MVKRIYWESVKKWAIRTGIPAGIAGFSLLIYYLVFIEAIIINGASGDLTCAGTIEDPCLAFVNFTANEDIFLYPLDYDPWGRNTPFETDKELESWKIYRSWNYYPYDEINGPNDWREIKLNETCKGTWCGGKYGTTDNKYSFAFREGRDYIIKIEAFKKDPTETIKWSFGPLDPVWSSYGEVDLLYNTDHCLTECYAILNITIYNSSKVLLDKVEFKNKLNQLKEINYKFEYVSGYKPKEIYEYETICYSNVTGNQTETCYKNKTASEIVYTKIWSDFNPFQKIPIGNYEVKLIGNKEWEEDIDWVPTFYGKEVDKWAWWLGEEPIAYWKMNEASDGGFHNATDSSPYGNNGTNNGDITFVSGKLNNAANLDYGSTDYFVVSNTALYDLNGSFSIAVWVNFTMAQLADYNHILMKNKANANGNWEFQNHIANKRMQFYGVDRVTGSAVDIKANQTYANDSEWHRVVVTRDGSTSTDNLKIYIDNVLVNTTDCPSSYKFTGDDGSDLRIGKKQPIGGKGGGWLDDIQIWNITWSASDVTTDWNEGTGREAHAVGPPNLTIISPLNTTYPYTQLDFNVSSDSNLDSCNFTMDSATYYMTAFTSTYFNYTNSSMANGQYTAKFECIESLDGSLNDTEQVTFVVNVGVPGLTIESPLNTTYTTSVVDFNISSDRALSFCNFTIDNWASYPTMTKFNTTYYNFTNLTMINGRYTAKFVCNDTFGFMNDTEQVNFVVDVSVLSKLFLEGKHNNLTAELGTNLNITSNGSGTICISIDHSEYGEKYSCETAPFTIDFNISYFNRNEFNDTTTKTHEFASTSLEYYIEGHQYDEVLSLFLNLTGEKDKNNKYPYNLTIYKTNKTDIYRIFYGNFTENVSSNFFDDFTYRKNFTWSTYGTHSVYFWMDNSSNLVGMFLNMTNYSYGFEFYDSLKNYSKIDISETNAHMINEVIMPEDDGTYSVHYDNFTDGLKINKYISNIETWNLNGTWNLSAERGNAAGGSIIINISESERRFDMKLFAAGAVTPPGEGNITLNSTLNLSRYEMETLNFSIVIRCDLPAGAVVCNNSVLFGEQLVYSKDGAHEWNKQDFGLYKINLTDWYVHQNGTNIKNITTISDNLFFKVRAKGGTTSGTNAIAYMNISFVNQTLWNRKESKIISESVYDSATNIISATLNVTNNSIDTINFSLYLSADDGQNWESVTNNIEHTFVNAGRNLKWKADIYNVSNSTPVFRIYEYNIFTNKGTPVNLTFDFGNDGIVEENVTDFNFERFINLTNANLSSILNSSIYCPYLNGTLCRIPLEIFSETAGQLEIHDILFEYDPNPIEFERNSLTEFLGNSSGKTGFPINISSDTTGNLSLLVNYNYAGGNSSINITAHTPDYSSAITYFVTYFYSKWDFEFPRYVNYLEFIPSTPSSKNVTPYGQSSQYPIFNITTYNYGGRNMNLSIYLNETHSCVNLTWNTNSNKSRFTSEAAGIYGFYDDFETDFGHWATNVGINCPDFDAWGRRGTSTSSSNTGPQDGGVGGVGTYFIYVETSSTNCYDSGDIALVYFNTTIDYNLNSNEKIEFYFHAYGATIDNLYMEENSTGTWISLFNMSDNNNDYWNFTSVDLSGLTGNGSLRFNYTRTSTGFTSDISLDRINVTYATSSIDVQKNLLSNSWDYTNVSLNYLSNPQIWLWADYSCNYSTWQYWWPDLYLRGCCEDCICSEVI